MERILKACRDICTTANHSVNFANDFDRLQLENDPDLPPLKLLQDVPTRWNSSFLMLQRISQLKDVILKMAANDEYKSLKQLKSGDWVVISNAVEVLKPFFEITEQLSHNSACISEVFHYLFKDQDL